MTEPFYFKRYDMVIGKAEDLSELRKELERLRIEDPLAVLYHIREGHISMWAMKSTYSFQQSPVTFPPSKSSSGLFYIIVGVVIAAVVIAIISLLYVSRRKNLSNKP